MTKRERYAARIRIILSVNLSVAKMRGKVKLDLKVESLKLQLVVSIPHSLASPARAGVHSVQVYVLRYPQPYWISGVHNLLNIQMFKRSSIFLLHNMSPYTYTPHYHRSPTLAQNSLRANWKPFQNIIQWSFQNFFACIIEKSATSIARVLGRHSTPRISLTCAIVTV